MTFGPIIPILRMFNEAKAREFYVAYLGFKVDWEHRFEPELPLYLQVSRDGCLLHLTEHHGDCSPGAAIRISIDGVEAFHAELAKKAYGYARPCIETPPWGGCELTVIDPFQNRLVFVERRVQ